MSPITYTFPHWGPLDTIVNEIWALNDQYFVFYIQNRARTTHMPFWDMFCAHTGLHEKVEIIGVQLQYFAESLPFL